MPAAPDFPPLPDQVRVKRALISIYDKSDLVQTARALHDLGVELGVDRRHQGGDRQGRPAGEGRGRPGPASPR